MCPDPEQERRGDHTMRPRQRTWMDASGNTTQLLRQAPSLGVRLLNEVPSVLAPVDVPVARSSSTVRSPHKTRHEPPLFSRSVFGAARPTLDGEFRHG